MGLIVSNLHKNTIDYLTAWTSKQWIELFNDEMQRILDVTNEGIGVFAATERRCSIIQNIDESIPEERKNLKVLLSQDHANHKVLFQVMLFPYYRPVAVDLHEVDKATHACIRELTTEALVKRWVDLYRADAY